MILRETEDVDYIKSVMLHDSVWPYVCDDSCAIDDYEPVLVDGVDYLVAESESGLHGLYILVKANAVTAELHIAFLPKMGGVSQSFLMLQDYAASKGYKRLRAWLSPWNKVAYRAAKREGFALIGIEKDGLLKDGKSYDLHLLGKTLWQAH